MRLIRVLGDQILLLELGALEVGEKVEHLELELLLPEEVAATPVNSGYLKEVNGHYAIDQFKSDVSLKVLLSQLYMRLLIFQEE